jgi:hypothetical protein
MLIVSLCYRSDTTVTAELQPLPPAIPNGPSPSTTSFLVTFPNKSAAETARDVAATHISSFLSINSEPNNRTYRGNLVAASKRRQINLPGKEQIDPTMWYSRSLMRSFLQENLFPRVDSITGKPVRGPDPKRASSNSTTLRQMNPEEKLEAASEYVKAFREARIGPFGTDAKARARNERPMSGRQVVMWGMPDAIQERTWTRVLKGYKLAEEDAVFHVPK